MGAPQGNGWTELWCGCARLAYWSLLKPFTLVGYLWDVHPDLVTHPWYGLPREVLEIPEVARLRSQMAALMVVVPSGAMAIGVAGERLLGGRLEELMGLLVAAALAVGSSLGMDWPGRGHGRWLIWWRVISGTVVLGICVSRWLALGAIPAWAGSAGFALLLGLAYGVGIRAGRRVQVCLALLSVAGTILYIMLADWLRMESVLRPGRMAAVALAGASLLLLRVLPLRNWLPFLLLSGAFAIAVPSVPVAPSDAAWRWRFTILGLAFGTFWGTSLPHTLFTRWGVANLATGFLLGPVIWLGCAAKGYAIGSTIALLYCLSYTLGVFRVYSWLLEALWMVGLWAAGVGGQAGRLLHWLPIYRDETIMLPLPFLERFLIEAYRSNEGGVQHAVNYLAMQSFQHGVARRVQLRIVQEQMIRCASTREIAALSRGASWPGWYSQGRTAYWARS